MISIDHVVELRDDPEFGKQLYIASSQIKAQDLSAKIGKCDNKTKAMVVKSSLHLKHHGSSHEPHRSIIVTVNVPCSEALALIHSIYLHY